jgi:hypothetical protein
MTIIGGTFYQGPEVNQADRNLAERLGGCSARFLSSTWKGPLGPTPALGDQTKSNEPWVDAAVQRIVREILWIYSPWRYVAVNATVIAVTTVLIPWIGVLWAAKSKNPKESWKYLYVTLLFAPMPFHVITEFRFGLWTASQHIATGHFPIRTLRHGIPEMAAYVACALIPMHYYLRHVRGASGTRYSVYCKRHLGTYAFSAGLIVLAAFIEAGRLWK